MAYQYRAAQLSAMNINQASKNPGTARSRKTPWWNKPLFGKQSLTQRLLARFQKPEVSERAIDLHRESLYEITSLTESAIAIDSDKIGSPEFLSFYRLKRAIHRGEVGFPGFEQSIELLKVGIQSKDNFLKIEQIEVAYRSSAQQELYVHVENALNEGLDPSDFIYQLEKKMLEIKPRLKTEEGLVAIKSYTEALKYLSSHDLSFFLLGKFKKYKLKDYTILQNISKLVHTITIKGIHDFKGLMTEVIAQQSSFEKLGEIISIPPGKDSLENYAIILQYITLSSKYELAYMKFQELVQLLELWKVHYDKVVGIRQEFDPKEYTVPQDFKLPIPGLELYQKYEKYFNDSQSRG
jgi:hypothetical protein